MTIMDDSVNQLFSFHSHIASTYLEVHEWLSQVLDLGDTSSNYKKKVTTQPSWRTACRSRDKRLTS